LTSLINNFSWIDVGWVFSESMSSILASLTIFYAITLHKNIVDVSIIEMTYPVFTVLFVFLFFGKLELTFITFIASILIMSGAYLFTLNE